MKWVKVNIISAQSQSTELYQLYKRLQYNAAVTMMVYDSGDMPTGFCDPIIFQLLVASIMEA